MRSFNEFFITNEIDEEEKEVEEEKDNENTSSWATIIFDLCNDDITKIDLVLKRNTIEVLNFLRYKKIKIDRENERIKRQK